MITVFRGNEKIVCTKNTYEEQLKHLGYQIASVKEEVTEKVTSFEKEKEEIKEDTDYQEELSEKYKINKSSGRKRK